MIQWRLRSAVFLRIGLSRILETSALTSNNVGLRAARGRHVLFSTPVQLFLSARWMCVGYTVEHPKVGACGPKLLTRWHWASCRAFRSIGTGFFFSKHATRPLLANNPWTL